MKEKYKVYREPYTKLWNEGESYKTISEKLEIPFGLSIYLRKVLELPSRMETRYSVAGKLETIITDADFKRIITKGEFKKEEHKGYAALVYYSAVRREEARRALKEYFSLNGDVLIFDVKKRLKHGIITPPLEMPIDLFAMEYLVDAMKDAPEKEPVFNYSPKTCYNIMRRAGFGYTHHCRLSRITQFFLEGWTIPQVRSWTGLSLAALNYYIALVDIKKMGRSLK